MDLLQVKELKTHFISRKKIVRACDGLSFNLEKGKTLGIVGESGSGKSVSMHTIMGLIPRTIQRTISGQALFAGQDLLKLREKELRKIRGKKISMIFQDPMTSLNPYLTIYTQIAEVLFEHFPTMAKSAVTDAVIDSLRQVGIPDAEKRMYSYPHEFSGGMRQRVMIAMALISKPDLIIADEPTTALDVTVQAQILDLLKKLQAELSMSIILITHDMGVIAGLADEVIVMYGGRIVEQGSVDDLFYDQMHPYTKGLLKSMPSLDSGSEPLYTIPGLPPDPAHLPQGCYFRERCPFAIAQCGEDIAVPKKSKGENHFAYCHLSEE